MSKTTIDRRSMPVDETVDPEVLAFRQQFDEKSPLDQLVREGARRMLQAAIDAEVEGFVARHDGYMGRFGLAHEREIRLNAEGDRITGRDRLMTRDGRDPDRSETSLALARSR